MQMLAVVTEGSDILKEADPVEKRAGMNRSHYIMKQVNVKFMVENGVVGTTCCGIYTKT